MRGQLGELLPLILLIFLVAGGGYAFTQVLGQLNSLSQTLKTMKNEIIVSLILLALISYIWKTKQSNTVTIFIAFMCVLYMIYKIMYVPAVIFGSDGYIMTSTGIKPVTQTIFYVSNHGKTVDLNQFEGERDCLLETSVNGTPNGKALCFYWEGFKPSGLVIGSIYVPNLYVYLYVKEYNVDYEFVNGVYEPVLKSMVSEEIYKCTGPITGSAKCNLISMSGYPKYFISNLYFEGVRDKELEYSVSINSNFVLVPMPQENAGIKFTNKTTKSEIYIKNYYVGTRDDEYVYHLTFAVLCTPNVRFFVKFYNSILSVTEMEGGQDYCNGKINYVNVTVPTNEPYTGFVIVMESGGLLLNKVSRLFKLPKLPIQKRKAVKVNNTNKLINLCKNNSLKSPVNIDNHIYTVSKEFRITKDYRFITYVDTNDFTNLSYILLCNKVSTPILILNTNKNSAVKCNDKVCSFLIDVQLPNISKNNVCELYIFKNGKTLIKERYTFKLNITKKQQESYNPNYSNQNINYPTSTLEKILKDKIYFYYLMIIVAVILIAYMIRRR